MVAVMLVLSLVLVGLAAWFLHRVLFPPADVAELRELTVPRDGRWPAPYDWETADLPGRMRRQLDEIRELPETLT